MPKALTPCVENFYRVERPSGELGYAYARNSAYAVDACVRHFGWRDGDGVTVHVETADGWVLVENFEEHAVPGTCQACGDANDCTRMKKHNGPHKNQYTGRQW